MKKPATVLITSEFSDMDEYQQDELNRKFVTIVQEVPQEAALLKLITICDTDFMLIYYKSMHWWGYGEKRADGWVAFGVNMCHDRQLAWIMYTGLIEKWCNHHLMEKVMCRELTAEDLS